MKVLKRALRKVARGIRYFHDGVSRAFLSLATALMAVITLSVLLQILMRYAFNKPIPWVEEWSVSAMFVMVFLTAPYLVLHQLNVHMSLFYDKLTTPFIKLLASMVLRLLILYSCVRFLPGVVDLVVKNASVSLTQLPISKAHLYAVVPIAFFLMASITLQKLIQDISTFYHSNHPPEKTAEAL